MTQTRSCHLHALTDVAAKMKGPCGARELVQDDDVRLRPSPLDGAGAPDHVGEVVVRDRDDGPYFVYPGTPHRSIAPVDQVDRAVRAIVH